MNTDVASLPGKWREQVRTQYGFGPTGQITLAHAEELESALAARSPAPGAGVGVEAVAKALWHRFGDDSRLTWDEEHEKDIYRDAAKQVITLSQHPAAPSVSPAVEGDGLPENPGWRKAWEAVAVVPTEVAPGWDSPDGTSDMVRACNTIRRLASGAPQGEAVGAALEYLHPHLDAGTFAAPEWAIDLASILTGGKRLTPPPAPTTGEST